jgi:hypothetical protein
MQKDKRMTLEDARRHSIRQGWYFFNPKAIQFWQSLFESPLYEGGYFICSYVYPYSSRKRRYYVICKVNLQTGEVSKLEASGIREFCTRNGAHLGLKMYLKELSKNAI